MTEEEGKEELKKLFEVWVSTGLKVQIVVFFHDNPGVVETLEGLARRMGITTEALRQEIRDHVALGIIRERHVGDKTVLVYNKSKEQEIQDFITERLKHDFAMGGPSA